MEILNTKQKIVIIVICSIVIVLIGIYIISKTNKGYEKIEENMVSEIEDEKIKEEVKEETEEIILHITGAVANEGIIKLEKGARLIDAIEEAGGATIEADLSKINLAYNLEDGQKIYIPKEGEENNEYIIEEKMDNITGGQNKTKKQLININTATQTELETITGVGPSTALKIINYRKENGKFRKIEDIKNVSGIGDNKFEGLKNEICVN